MTATHTHTPARAAWRDADTLPVSLVLEGRGMRGLFTAGVCDFLLEHGICAEQVIGTSAGALNGFNYVSGAIGRTAYLNVKYCTDWHYLSMRNFAVTGDAFNSQMLFHEIPERLDPFDFADFEESPMTLTTVASDLERGDADYHEHHGRFDDRAIAYVSASASMPFVSHIVSVDGKMLLDGGTCDSVPYLYHRFKAVEPKQIVVLTRDPTYRKKKLKLSALAQRLYGDYPLYIDRLENRHFEYNLCYRRLHELDAAGKLFLIEPAVPVTVQAMEHDPDALLDLYGQGYGAALSRWEDLQRYLEL